MTAKEYLEQIKKYDTMIENKIAEQRQWLDVALSSTAGGESVRVFNPKTGKYELHKMDKVQTAHGGQRMADAMDNYVDIGQEINRCIDELWDKKQEIIKTIEQLCESEYDVLHKMYVQYLTFDDIAAKRDKSRSWVTSTHGQALKNLENILNCNKMCEKV